MRNLIIILIFIFMVALIMRETLIEKKLREAEHSISALELQVGNFKTNCATVWLNKTNSGDPYQTRLKFYPSDGSEVGIGFRSDGTVVWREE